MNLGENIKRRREELKLSQEYVADRLGVSRQAVSKWETGRAEPTAGNLIALAQVLEISLAELTQSGQVPRSAADKKPNPILRANLVKTAIIFQGAMLFSAANTFFLWKNARQANKALYKGGVIFYLILLFACSRWMTFNHLFEPNLTQRSKNTKIELGYCCAQMAVGFGTAYLGLGLVGMAAIIALMTVYILYVNPKFMGRKLTK